MTVLMIYLIFLLGVGIIDFRKVQDFNDYVLAGRRQKLAIVTVSLMASMIGSGSTIGLADKAFSKGFPAIWFLAVGGIGLILQAWLLSEKVRASRAVTLPDLAQQTMGPQTRFLVALIIVVTWIGIIAAQFIATGKILAALTGVDSRGILALAAVIIVVYSFLGGQASILKTDFLQFATLAAAVLFTALFLYTAKPVDVRAISFQLTNDVYTARDLFYYLTIVMGSYFICPMMFSRLLTAKTPQTARRSSLIAGFGVLVFAFLIVLIGLWAQNRGVDPGKSGVLGYIFLNELPRAGGLILILGVLSAVISTTDTCLVMTASIIEHDLLSRQSTAFESDMNRTRALVLLLGSLGYLTALWGNWDIIGLLLEAFEFYTAGIVPALFVALMVIRKKRLAPKWSFAAVLTGGLFGLLPKIAPVVDGLGQLIPGFWAKSLPMVGMGLSLVLAIIAVRHGIPVKQSAA
ncbi:sodium:solute symporter family protein [Desulfosarcina ovata]|uniref:Sodium:proline symporter n=1 Tax=Desulfosarcina ovata subsp. ovata TaxID=2752305 RepID=A0A5K8A9W9_9BACT|nr:sodium:solute symporter family protein [Desulfosarcina ovata]BBO89258.1 sodium:proline symporter [Desulfosarcina ovata subsp. ovata]